MKLLRASIARLIGTFATSRRERELAGRTGEPSPDAHRRQPPRRPLAGRSAAPGAREARRPRIGQGAAPRSPRLPRAEPRRAGPALRGPPAAEGARLQRDGDRDDRPRRGRQRGDLHRAQRGGAAGAARARGRSPRRAGHQLRGRRTPLRVRLSQHAVVPGIRSRPRSVARVRWRPRVFRGSPDRHARRRGTAADTRDAGDVQLLRRAGHPRGDRPHVECARLRTRRAGHRRPEPSPLADGVRRRSVGRRPHHQPEPRAVRRRRRGPGGVHGHGAARGGRLRPDPVSDDAQSRAGPSVEPERQLAGRDGADEAGRLARVHPGRTGGRCRAAHRSAVAGTDGAARRPGAPRSRRCPKRGRWY